MSKWIIVKTVNGQPGDIPIAPPTAIVYKRIDRDVDADAPEYRAFVQGPLEDMRELCAELNRGAWAGKPVAATSCSSSKYEACK